MSSFAIIVGISYLLVGLFGIFTNLLCSYLITINKEFRNASYVYIINLNIADAIVLLPIAVYLGLIEINSNFQCNLCDRIFHSFIQIGWWPSGCYFVLISFTRLVVLKYRHYNKVIFSKKFLIATSAIPWIVYSMVGLFSLMYPKITGIVYPDLFTWGINQQHLCGITVAYYNVIHSMLCSLVNCCFNVISLIWIRRTRNRILSTHRSKSRKKEIKLFFQCLITSSFYVGACVMYTIVFRFAHLMLPVHFLITHCIWILHHCISPVIYFTLNVKLRNSLKILLFR